MLKILVSRYLTDPLSAKRPPCPVYRLRLSRRLPRRGSVELCKGGGLFRTVRDGARGLSNRLGRRRGGRWGKWGESGGKGVGEGGGVLESTPPYWLVELSGTGPLPYRIFPMS